MEAPHVIEAHEKFIDSFVQKFVFDKQLGANYWEYDYNNAVDFWSVYLSHLLTNCSVGGYIDDAFRAQYHKGLLPWQIQIPTKEMSDDEVEHLPDGQQRTHKRRAVVPPHNQSDSYDACGWPTD